MPSPAGPSVVLCPLAIERQAVQRVLGTSNLSHVTVVQTGVGKHAVVAAVERLALAPAPQRAALVVLAGACGALAPVADVPSIARVIDEHGSSWGDRAGDPLAVGFDHGGVTLVAVDRIVSTPADKHALHRATGAAIVDMESHAFASACERLGLRYSIVRGVSDTPDETLPEETLRWIRPDGSTRTARAVVDLLLRPGLIPHMVAVMRRCGRVLPNVGERVREVLAAETDHVSKAPAITPLPRGPFAAGVPIDTIVLFGGSFDPPTLAHLDLAGDVAKHLSSTEPHTLVLYVPAARSPHKPDSPRASDAQRLAMLLAMTEPANIWTDELDRAPGPSYSIDTARRARRWLDDNAAASTKLRLLIGADQAAAFHRWRQPRELIALAEPLVMLREDVDTPESLVGALRATGFWSEPELAAWLPRIVPIKLREGSASRARELIATRGVDAPELSALLHPLVRRYIADHDLYRAPSL